MPFEGTPAWLATEVSMDTEAVVTCQGRHTHVLLHPTRRARLFSRPDLPG